MKYNFGVFLGIFIALAASRFIPHPPNFTSLIALSFYVPLIFGLKYLPILILSFAITDFIIGYHNLTHFTWGSVSLIGLLSHYFSKNLLLRLSGAFLSALIFFIITNFGVWIYSGIYQLNLAGLLQCYILALPFFGYSAISTLLFSTLIEAIHTYLKNRFSLKIK